MSELASLTDRIDKLLHLRSIGALVPGEADEALDLMGEFLGLLEGGDTEVSELPSSWRVRHDYEWFALDGSAQRGGDVGGDAQYGTAWTKRFARQHTYDPSQAGTVEEGARFDVVDVAIYLAWLDPNAERDEWAPVGSEELTVISQITYTIASDLDDVGSSELWSDTVYEDEGGEWWVEDELDEKHVREYVNQQVTREAIQWDGKPWFSYLQRPRFDI